MSFQPAPPGQPLAAPSPNLRAPPIHKGRKGRGAWYVALGIFVSKMVGLVRTQFTSYFLGDTGAAAAFWVALRIPNLLQNLFGEGVLSSSFIPIYARLVGQGEVDEADRVAGTVFGVLSLVVSVLVALGVTFSAQIVSLIVSSEGFDASTRALTVTLMRIMFPGTGLLVMSAWCLGVLNSHRRFFLSYVSPVVWSLAQIVAIVCWGRHQEPGNVAVYLSWGMVAGSFLQFTLQLPTVMALLGRFRPSLSLASKHARDVFKGLGPVMVSRGVVQLSAYVDMQFITRVSTQAAAGLSYVQTLTLLPISLFGMAVSASELPEMSQDTGSQEEVARKIRERINGGMQRIAFFVVPSVAAFFFLGDVVTATLFQHGRFGADGSRFAWYMLMGSCLGLLAQTFGRLYSSAFYALKDTRTPFYFALIRVTLTVATAYVSVVYLPGWLGVPKLVGAVGITGTTGLAAWIEFVLLRAGLARRVGRTGFPLGRLAKLWVAAILASAAGLAIKVALTHHYGWAPKAFLFWGGELFPAPNMPGLLLGACVIPVFGLIYFAVTGLLGVSELTPYLRRLLRR